MSTILRFNGTEEPYVQEPSLEQMQKVVKGYVEVVPIPDSENKVMLVNEEGRLLRLPVNMKASNVAHTVIVGDVLICEKTPDGKLL